MVALCVIYTLLLVAKKIEMHAHNRSKCKEEDKKKKRA